MVVGFRHHCSHERAINLPRQWHVFHSSYISCYSLRIRFSVDILQGHSLATSAMNRVAKNSLFGPLLRWNPCLLVLVTVKSVEPETYSRNMVVAATNLHNMSFLLIIVRWDREKIRDLTIHGIVFCFSFVDNMRVRSDFGRHCSSRDV